MPCPRFISTLTSNQTPFSADDQISLNRIHLYWIETEGIPTTAARTTTTFAEATPAAVASTGASKSKIIFLAVGNKCVCY